MGCAVMREAAGKVSVLEEIGGEGLELIVEGVLAMRPGPEEMPDIAPAAFAARADEGRRHLHLVKGLIPDVVEAIRLRHPGPYSRIDEIEKKQPGDAFLRQPRQRLHQCTTDIVTDDTRLREAKRSINTSMSAACWSGPNGPSGLSLRRSRAGRVHIA